MPTYSPGFDTSIKFETTRMERARFAGNCQKVQVSMSKAFQLFMLAFSEMVESGELTRQDITADQLQRWQAEHRT